MKLLTKAIESKLLANHAATQAAQTAGKPEPDHKPVCKLFYPAGAATWLISEMDESGVMFGLCDLGHGTPELGSVHRSELEQFRGRFGLGIERDLHFSAIMPLSEYAACARSVCRITA